MSRSARFVTALAGLVVIVGAWAIRGAATGQAAPAKGRPAFEVFAVRYAVAPGVPVSSLVAGAEASRRIDIPFMIWVLEGGAQRNVLVDAGSYRGPVFERWKLRDVVKPSVAVAS